MRIWLATVGEPLPFDGDNVRLLRTAQFAQWLSDKGHEVVFWTGAMDHYGRRLRSETTEFRQVAKNYTIVLLEGRLYQRSISFARSQNHRDVARSFRKEAPKLPLPDIILTSFPTAELCLAVADYAESHNVPFVVDARDFWPDLFVEVLPSWARPLAPLIFALPERQTRRVFARASAVAGMTASAMHWALHKAGRPQNAHDFWHPFPYVKDSMVAGDQPPADIANADVPPDHLTLCFFGTHSHRVNLEMFVDAFRVLAQRRVPATILLCGKGPVTEELRRRAAGLENVRFPGWLDARQIQSVISVSDVGVLPYNTPDFFMNLPNKVAEYLSGGLPILSCTDGEMRSLIENEGCGFWCEPEITAIADTVENIAHNPQRVAVARKRADEVYSQNFERETVFGNVLERLTTLARSSAA